MYLRSVLCLAIGFSFPALSHALVPTAETSQGLEFRGAETTPADGLTEAIAPDTGKKIYLHKQAAATSKDVADVRFKLNKNGKARIAVDFTKDGTKKMAKLTEKLRGKHLAILVDGKVISAPIIREPITGGKAEISGSFTKQEAARLVEAIKGK